MRDVVVLISAHYYGNYYVSGTVIVFIAQKRERERKKKFSVNSSQVASTAFIYCNPYIHSKIEYGELNRSLFRMHYVLPFLLSFFVPQCINNTDRNYCEFWFVFAWFNTAFEMATRNYIVQPRYDQYLHIHIYILESRISYWIWVKYRKISSCNVNIFRFFISIIMYQCRFFYTIR